MTRSFKTFNKSKNPAEKQSKAFETSINSLKNSLFNPGAHVFHRAAAKQIIFPPSAKGAKTKCGKTLMATTFSKA